MDKDRNESRRSEVAGSVKELIGKLVGDKRIEEEGAREKAGHPGGPGFEGSTAPDADKRD